MLIEQLLYARHWSSVNKANRNPALKELLCISTSFLFIESNIPLYGHATFYLLTIRWTLRYQTKLWSVHPRAAHLLTPRLCFFCVFLFLAVPCVLWDLSSLTQATAVKEPSPNYQTAREVPQQSIFF